MEVKNFNKNEKPFEVLAKKHLLVDHLEVWHDGKFIGYFHMGKDENGYFLHFFSDLPKKSLEFERLR
jgi:hypothetical protein